MSELQEIIISFVNSVKKIETLESEFRKIPSVGKLIFNGTVPKNPISAFVIPTEVNNKTLFTNSDYVKYKTSLDEISDLVNNNLFMKDVFHSIDEIKDALDEAYKKVTIKDKIKDIVKDAKENCDSYIENATGENARKQQQFEQLITKIKEYTEGNRVKLIKIGNLELSGVEVRTLLSLRSANFKVTIEKDNIIFEVTGYGHGVGMSQTGADSLAKQGKSYEEIIHHFYSGVKVQDI